MTDFLRLRQICLAANELEPAVDAVRDIFGVEVCYRDPNVAKYGLVNALFVFGHAFLEIIAPTRPDTTAGRFIERSGGRGGYMAIFDCNDPQRRRELVQSMDVRVANVLDHPGFWGIQLHPRDCRATMLEFDRSQGNDSLDGAYHPAGADWRAFQRLQQVSGITTIDVQTPDPTGLAAHWGRICDRPVTTDADGVPLLRFDLGAARFVPAVAGDPGERLSAMTVAVGDPARVLDAARRRGLVMQDGGFELGGMRMVPVAGG